MKTLELTTSAAQAAYRQAWQQFLMSPPGSVRNQLDDLMNQLQGSCSAGEGAWEAFTITLPGWVSFHQDKSTVEQKSP